jgi:hypothetical protein
MIQNSRTLHTLSGNRKVKVDGTWYHTKDFLKIRRFKSHFRKINTWIGGHWYTKMAATQIWSLCNHSSASCKVNGRVCQDKVKGKFSLWLFFTEHHAMKVYCSNGGIAPSILLPRHQLEVSGQLHATAALPHGRRPWYPLDRMLGGPQSRSGRGGEEKIPIPPRRESKPKLRSSSP